MKKIKSFQFANYGDRIADDEIGESIALFGSVRKAYRLLVE
jgi:hypothetical protein